MEILNIPRNTNTRWLSKKNNPNRMTAKLNINGFDRELSLLPAKAWLFEIMPDNWIQIVKKRGEYFIVSDWTEQHTITKTTSHPTKIKYKHTNNKPTNFTIKFKTHTIKGQGIPISAWYFTTDNVNVAPNIPRSRQCIANDIWIGSMVNYPNVYVIQKNKDYSIVVDFIGDYKIQTDIREYYILCDGFGAAFVRIDTQNKTAYFHIDDKIDENDELTMIKRMPINYGEINYNKTPSFSFEYIKAFPGKLDEDAIHKLSCWKVSHEGSAMLFLIDYPTLTYRLINNSDRIYDFMALSPITHFYGPHGGRCSTFPWAIDNKGNIYDNSDGDDSITFYPSEYCANFPCYHIMMEKTLEETKHLPYADKIKELQTVTVWESE